MASSSLKSGYVPMPRVAGSPKSNGDGNAAFDSFHRSTVSRRNESSSRLPRKFLEQAAIARADYSRPPNHGNNVSSDDVLGQQLVDDPRAYDLIPVDGFQDVYSLENRVDLLFSPEHLLLIIADSMSLLKFSSFLAAHRPASVSVLIYYLDASKALKAINYANAIAEALEPAPGYDFTSTAAAKTVNLTLQYRADQAFKVLCEEDLPAYITDTYIGMVSKSALKNMTEAKIPRVQDFEEEISGVFCMTDPSRPDNPIIFASEEFQRMTRYEMHAIIGRNCRFLQGPNTSNFCIHRIRKALKDQKEHYEVVINYRRDGSPFLNLLMCSPLSDNYGKIRYFLGILIDVSKFAKECTGFDALQRLVKQNEKTKDTIEEEKDEFQELVELLNKNELETVMRWGGRMFEEVYENKANKSVQSYAEQGPKVPSKSTAPVVNKSHQFGGRKGVRLKGFYQNYLLVRPFPSLRILFASPSMQQPGIMQTPLLNKINSSSEAYEDLTRALETGNEITSRVHWMAKRDQGGRQRWLRCTPLLSSNGQIGVWFVIIVDDEQADGRLRRQAPPVSPSISRNPSIADLKISGPDATDIDFDFSYPTKSHHATAVKVPGSVDSERDCKQQPSSPVGPTSMNMKPNPSKRNGVGSRTNSLDTVLWRPMSPTSPVLGTTNMIFGATGSPFVTASRPVTRGTESEVTSNEKAEGLDDGSRLIIPPRRTTYKSFSPYSFRNG